MPDQAFLSVFTPSRTAPEDLEAIFVQRHDLLADAVERVRESATTGNKHHLLFVGPRGTGKTHLVTLLVHRVSQASDLTEKLHIAWLNEDETSTTFLEFLRRIYLALTKRYPDGYSEADLEPIYDLDANSAEQKLADLLLEHLQTRTLLVVVENLDALFEGLGEAGQKRLRAFIQENPVLSIVATAQRLVDDLAKRKSVFFGFFQTESLLTLTVEDAAELLAKIARLNRQPDAAAFLNSPVGHARIQALHHLSGGNHRVYIVLSQFITRENLDSLVVPFAKMIDEMTPYYQERIRWLPAQQRKIVEHLCTRERPVPVKELARRLFASQQTISSQLMDLRNKGYVQSAQRGRESLYEIAEPLMRICVEIKENQTPGPMRLLVDFLRVWYDERGLSSRLQACEDGSLGQTYLQAAIDRNAELGNLCLQLILDGLRIRLGEEQGERWVMLIEFFAKESEELALACGEWSKGNSNYAIRLLEEIAEQERDQSPAVRALACILAGMILFVPETLDQSANALQKVLEIPDAPANLVVTALNNLGAVYEQLGDYEKAIVKYSAIVEFVDALASDIAIALNNRGAVYEEIGAYKEAIADYSAVIELSEAPNEEIIRALTNRSIIYSELGENEKEVADYSSIITSPYASNEDIVNALYNRGIAYAELGKNEEAITDYSTIISLQNISKDKIYDALFQRASSYAILMKIEKTIADYDAMTSLPEISEARIIKAIFIRGLFYESIGYYDKAIADFTLIITMPTAQAINIAMALTKRGILYLETDEQSKAIADFDFAKELPNIPNNITNLLIEGRAIANKIVDLARSEQDYESLFSRSNIPLNTRVNAKLDLTQIRIITGRWDSAILTLKEGLALTAARDNSSSDLAVTVSFSTMIWDFAISALKKGLAMGAKKVPLLGSPSPAVTQRGSAAGGIPTLERGNENPKSYTGDSSGIIQAFFDSSLNPALRHERAAQLAQVYQQYNALASLGEALIVHLGKLHRDPDKLPTADNLEQWAVAWEEAGQGMDGLRLPLRIFRTGIDFLKMGGKDRGILLDLNQEERRILEQALGLDARGRGF